MGNTAIDAALFMALNDVSMDGTMDSYRTVKIYDNCFIQELYYVLHKGVQFIFIPGIVLEVLLSLPKVTPRKLLVPLVVSFFMLYRGRTRQLHQSSSFEEISQIAQLPLLL